MIENMKITVTLSQFYQTLFFKALIIFVEIIPGLFPGHTCVNISKYELIKRLHLLLQLG